MDIAHKQTDAAIDKIEKRIKKEFAQAQKEIERKANAYFKSFAEKDKKKLALVRAGKLTHDSYVQWRAQQILVGNKWDEMTINMSKDLSNARNISASIVKGGMPDVYAENFNYATYTIEKGTGIDTSFTLYNRQAVERLLRDDPAMLPDPTEAIKNKIKQKKIQRWSRQKMTSAVTQAILQGESLDKLAKRLRSVTSMDAASSVRNARTMLTNAQNAGRYNAFERAKELGVKFKVVWIATLDNRTRHEHRLLDGQMQDVGEPFHVGGIEIMYPADYGGKNYKVPPDMIYNCRCTIGAAVKGSKLATDGINSVDRPNSTGMSYDEWKQGKAQPKKTASGTAKPTAPKATAQAQKKPKTYESDTLKKAMGSEYDGFADKVANADNRILYEKYMEGLDVEIVKSGGYAFGSGRGFKASYEKHEGMDKYSTVAHEANHIFDRKCIENNQRVHFTEANTINDHTPIGWGTHKTVQIKASASDEFLTAVRKDANNLKAGLLDGSVRKKLLATTESRNATSGVQDMLDGFFSTQKGQSKYGWLPWGHGERYYNREYNRRIVGFDNEKGLKAALLELGFDASNQTKCKRLARIYDTASEAWANIGGAVTCGGMELDAVKEYMPESYKAYLHIIGGVN